MKPDDLSLADLRNGDGEEKLTFWTSVDVNAFPVGSPVIYQGQTRVVTRVSDHCVYLAKPSIWRRLWWWLRREVK